MMPMMKKADASAIKALSLGQDSIFRLLMIMLALLGWVAGMGAAGLFGLQQVYATWQLNQKSHVSVYLMPDSPPQRIEKLTDALISMPGIDAVNLMDQESTRDLLAPYVGADTPLPLPKVLDVQVNARLDREVLHRRVKDLFPMAEIDDARDMLAAVSGGVRFMQGVTGMVAFTVLAVMMALVWLTVRAGLRGKRQALQILQYVGAPDTFLLNLVTRQVAFWGGIGALGAACAALATLWLLTLAWPVLVDYTTWPVWLGAALMPMALLAVVLAATRLTAHHTLHLPEVSA